MADWKSNLTLGIEDLFSTQDIRDNGEIKTIKIDDVIPFKQHTFKVKHDAKLDELANSIKENGILVPAIAFRNEDDQIELISGHRRMAASQIIGNDTMPVIVKNIDRDTATIIMGETNLQSREEILPSEKAFTYKAMFDAMKRQGKRTDLTLSPVGTKLRSDAELAEKVGESRNQIQRYIRLTNLIPELLDLVDAKVMALRPAVEISYLDSINQRYIYDFYKEGEVRDEDGNIKTAGTLPSLAQAKEMKEKRKELDEETIYELLQTDKPNQKEKIIFKSDRLLSYRKQHDITDDALEDKIIKALDFYDKYASKINSRKHEREL
ncbi:MAG: ParB/RepB/Spo0J family partition protein [Lachnospiraceae bacterium]|nr:ParB/RepB/Spo0J family partition protein [Lachnospiraceae bacterium]